MPLYEYTCLGCGKLVELLVRGGQSPQCPHCGSPRLEKQLSVISAHTGSDSELPVCDSSSARRGPLGPGYSGGCGLPQCGTGGCQFG